MPECLNCHVSLGGIVSTPMPIGPIQPPTRTKTPPPTPPKGTSPCEDPSGGSGDINGGFISPYGIGGTGGLQVDDNIGLYSRPKESTTFKVGNTKPVCKGFKISTLSLNFALWVESNQSASFK